MSSHHQTTSSSLSSRLSRTSNAYVTRTITVNGKSAVSKPLNLVADGSVNEDPVAAAAAAIQTSSNSVQLKLTFLRVLGKGTFGCIEQAQLNDKSELVAVKRVFQDPRFKNRELDILLGLSDHPNLVRLLYYYYTSSNSNSSGGSRQHNTSSTAPLTGQGGSDAPAVGATGALTGPSSGNSSEIYLHLVMECFPESLADLIVRYCRKNLKIPIFDIKLYTYQLLRALGYIHLQAICHRDIKSSNLLVNEETGQVKLCDFGSAKKIVADQPNVAYISSRYYRAPELIFGAEHYDCSIDVWSAGCVVAELLIRKCLFMGSDSVEQLAEIIKVLGTPSQADVKAMNPRYSSYSFPNVSRCPLKLYLPMETPADLIQLLTRMLVYNAGQRVRPLVALSEPAFQVLRDKRAANLTSRGGQPSTGAGSGGDAAAAVVAPAAATTTTTASSTSTSSRRSAAQAVNAQRDRVPASLFKFLPKELDAEPSLLALHENSSNGEVEAAGEASKAGGSAGSPTSAATTSSSTGRAPSVADI